MGMTFAEKILAKYSGKKQLVPGEIVTVHPDHLLTHDNSAAIVGKISDDLEEFGVYSRSLPVIVLDHVIPAASEKTALNHRKIREFVKLHGVQNFFDVGSGVCHQVVVEKGFALPGKLLLGSDSHTCSYGAIGSFSSGIDRTEAASLLLTGETWLKVPHTIKMLLEGKLQSGVYAKDVILHIIGNVSASGATYCSVEFHGDISISGPDPDRVLDGDRVLHPRPKIGRGIIVVLPGDRVSYLTREAQLAPIGMHEIKTDHEVVRRKAQTEPEGIREVDVVSDRLVEILTRVVVAGYYL